MYNSFYIKQCDKNIIISSEFKLFGKYSVPKIPINNKNKQGISFSAASIQKNSYVAKKI